MPTLEDVSQVNRAVAESPMLLGKECSGCFRILEYSMFPRDSAARDGRKDFCDICTHAPKLSLSEHTYALRESNFNSHAVKAQRWSHQDEYRDDTARIGKAMYSTDFLRILRRLIPDLYMIDGRIVGDVAVFRTYGAPQPHLNGHSFEYLFYIPTGLLPEYSLYEFDEIRDVPLREKQRGWRTPLLRLIQAGMVTEEMCDLVFGKAEGPASSVWRRNLFMFRNRK